MAYERGTPAGRNGGRTATLPAPIRPGWHEVHRMVIWRDCCASTRPIGEYRAANSIAGARASKLSILQQHAGAPSHDHPERQHEEKRACLLHGEYGVEIAARQ